MKDGWRVDAAMAKSRRQKLKVYRTPIGFHDAYVAAPSQKAALEAWGTNANLFAQGAAELVVDEALSAVPLQRPGEVVKVLRGSRAEQVAALGKAAMNRAKTKDRSRSKAGIKTPRLARGARPKPSRAKLAKAEEAVAALRSKQARELEQIARQEQALARKRRELERRQRALLDALEQKAAEERSRYELAMEKRKRVI